MQDCTRACNVLNVLIMYLQVVFPGFGCGLFWTCLIVSHFFAEARAFWQHDVPQTFENVHRKVDYRIAASRKNMKESEGIGSNAS